MVAGFVVAGVIYVCACRDISRELSEVDLHSSDEPIIAAPAERAHRADRPPLRPAEPAPLAPAPAPVPPFQA
jgi:hypothetical protein